MKKYKADPAEVALTLSGQMKRLTPKEFSRKYGLILANEQEAAEITVPVPKGWDVRLELMYEYGPTKSQPRSGQFTILLVRDKECLDGGR